ncbi:MAG: hypothetical protein ACKN9D_13835 [Actinomycetales bacterium]
MSRVGTRARRGLALITPGVVLGIALVLPAQGAWAAPAATVTGSARSLLGSIPILPKMVQGLQSDSFGDVPGTKDAKGCSPRQQAVIARAVQTPRVNGPVCAMSGGRWLANFGTAEITNPGQLTLVPVMGLPAVWASGGYGWSEQERGSYLQDFGADPALATVADVVTTDGPQAADPSSGTFESVPWAANYALLTQSLAVRVTKVCRTSAETTCMLDVLPEALKPRAAAAIVATSIRNRLAMTRVEKIAVERWIDHFVALRPDAVFTVQTTDVPALPTTDGSDATGRVVGANLFGLLAPPAWNSTPNVPYATLRLWDSGVLWKDVQPSPDKFTWAPLDHAVRTAESQGKKVLLVLGPVPAWASADPAAPDESWGKGAAGPFVANGLADFERYVTAVVKRYGDRIWAYETWNEANLQTFWKGTPAEMAVMTKVVHDVIKANGAASLTLTASATTRTEGSIYRFFPTYLRELGKRGWPIDGYAVHAYPDADGTPSDVADFVAQYKAYLAIAGAPTKPIYNTELNYGLAGPGPKPHRDMNADESAGWLSRTFIDAVRLGIEETHWFAWTPQYYGQYGIQLTPTSTSSGQAWRATHSWLVGSTFKSCQEPEGAVICEFQRDGKPFWLAYADSLELIEAPGAARRYCTLQGECSALDGSMVIVDLQPIRLE